MPESGRSQLDSAGSRRVLLLLYIQHCVRSHSVYMFLQYQFLCWLWSGSLWYIISQFACECTVSSWNRRWWPHWQLEQCQAMLHEFANMRSERWQQLWQLRWQQLAPIELNHYMSLHVTTFKATSPTTLVCAGAAKQSLPEGAWSGNACDLDPWTPKKYCSVMAKRKEGKYKKLPTIERFDRNTAAHALCDSQTLLGSSARRMISLLNNVRLDPCTSWWCPFGSPPNWWFFCKKWPSFWDVWGCHHSWICRYTHMYRPHIPTINNCHLCLYRWHITLGCWLFFLLIDQPVNTLYIKWDQLRNHCSYSHNTSETRIRVCAKIG